MARTDDMVSAIKEAAEKFRQVMDKGNGLSGMVFSVRFGPNGAVVKVIARPEAHWRPCRQEARST